MAGGHSSGERLNPDVEQCMAALMARVTHGRVCTGRWGGRTWWEGRIGSNSNANGM